MRFRSALPFRFWLIAAVSALAPSAAPVVAQCPPTEIEALDSPRDALTQLGSSIAIDQSQVLIGATGLRHSSGTVGAAILYTTSNGASQIVAVLSDNQTTDLNDRFGRSVAMAGNVIAISRGRFDSVARDAVYVYERQDGAAAKLPQWVQTVALSDPEHNDPFGLKIVLQNGRLLIALQDSGRSVVRVYSPSRSSWAPTDEIEPWDLRTGINFGSGLAASSEWLAVGASQDSAMQPSAGSVYVYRLVEGKWTPFQHVAPTPAISFGLAGTALAIDDDRLVVSAPKGGTAQNGAIWVYRWDSLADRWEAEVYLENPTSQSSQSQGHFFGLSVSIRDSRLLVGSPFLNTNAPGVPERRGFCASYLLASGAWRLQSVFRPTDLPQGPLNIPPQFGASVALMGTEAVCAAPHAYAPTEPSGFVPLVGGVWSFDLDFPLFTILDNPPPETPIHLGAAAHISVTATGPEPLTYRWYRANTPIADAYPFSGVDTPTLTIDPVLPSHFGSEGYVCRVTSPCGTLSSTPGALLEVPPPPCMGDANGTRFVDMGDINAILMHWGASHPDTTSPGDANHDGVVNFEDITTTITFWFAPCP